MPKPGSLLQDRYEIVRVLGFGGMGRVYLAHHQGLGDMPVAIKELDLHVDPEALDAAAAEFQREATMLASLNHPALVRATDFFEEEGTCYLVMDYVAGPTLWEVLQQNPPYLELARVLDWADQLCDVLAYLHSQRPPVLYRDLKPGNLILDPEGRIRLIDFGLSRFAIPGTQTVTVFTGAGTPGFAPIEQYSGGTDERSDIYALGATLYHLLTGEIPNNSVALLSGEEILLPPRHFNPSIPLAVQSCILKMMALRREDRYASVVEAREAMRRAGSGVSLQGREFRICALCRHLQSFEEEPQSYLFRCHVLGWTSREELMASVVEQHLQLQGVAREGGCPHWEPA